MQPRSRIARLSSRAVSAAIKQPQRTQPLATVVDRIQKVSIPTLVPLISLTEAIRILPSSMKLVPSPTVFG